MAVSVRLEAEAFDDPRFAVLAKRLGIDRFSALGRMAKVWGYCTQAEAYWLPDVEFDVLFDVDGAADAAVESRLVERGDGDKSGFVRVRGTKGRIEWKQKLRKNSKKGGEARKAKTKPNGGQKATQTEAKAEPKPSPPSPSPTPERSTPQGPPAGGEGGQAELPGSNRAPPGIAGEGALSRTKRRLLNRWRDEAWRLWGLQDELRIESIAGARKLKPTAEALLRVADRLEAGNSPEDCERVLRVCAAQAKRDPTAADWFNGETNWRPKAFGIKLGMADTVLPAAEVAQGGHSVLGPGWRDA